jgi:hypothetical protein
MLGSLIEHAVRLIWQIDLVLIEIWIVGSVGSQLCWIDPTYEVDGMHYSVPLPTQPLYFDVPQRKRCCCHSSTCTFPPQDSIALIGCGTFGANGCSNHLQSTYALCIFCIFDRSEVLLGSKIIYRVLLLDWALTSFFRFLVWQIALQIHLAILGGIV